MYRFELVSASATKMDAAAGDSKPNCQKTFSACKLGGSQAFACASRSHEQLFRAFQHVPCFSGRDTLFRSSSSSTVFCKFLCCRHFVEHRFKRPPHLRGGVDSGFAFGVNSFFQKSFHSSADSLCARVKTARTHRAFYLEETRAGLRRVHLHPLLRRKCSPALRHPLFPIQPAALRIVIRPSRSAFVAGRPARRRVFGQTCRPRRRVL